MKKLISLFVFLNGFSVFGVQFNLSLWEKDQVCQDVLCLPKTILRKGPIEIPEPQMNSFSRLEIPLNEIKVIFTLTKRQEFGGYYNFQTELKNTDGKTFALCSRYEAIETFENAPVGACAGIHPSTSGEMEKLLGISIFKINP